MNDESAIVADIIFHPQSSCIFTPNLYSYIRMSTTINGSLPHSQKTMAEKTAGLQNTYLFIILEDYGETCRTTVAPFGIIYRMSLVK